MKKQEWIEEFQEMLKSDAEVFAKRGKKTAANYARVLADDIKAQIQNWKENEEWEE